MPNRALYLSGPYRPAAFQPDAYQSGAYPFVRRPSGAEFLKHDQTMAGPFHPAQGAAHYPMPHPLSPKPRQRGAPWMALIIVHLAFGFILYTTGPLLFALLFGSFN
jgi:hypothetical protein